MLQVYPHRATGCDARRLSAAGRCSRIPATRNPTAKTGAAIEMIAFETAKQRILAGISPVREIEVIGVTEALWRVLSGEVPAPADVPRSRRKRFSIWASATYQCSSVATSHGVQ